MKLLGLTIALVSFLSVAINGNAGETKAEMEKAKGQIKGEMEEAKGEIKALKEEAKGNDIKATGERAKGNVKGAVEKGKGKVKELNEKMKDEIDLTARLPRRRWGGTVPDRQTYP